MANKVEMLVPTTIDHFGLAFQYPIFQNYKKLKRMDKNNHKLKMHKK